MRLTLIFPAIGKRRGKRYLRLWQMEPLSMAVLAALTPRDVELRFYDDRLEEIPFDEPTDLVAMTVETYTARRAYQIAAEYRRRKVPVVLGGFHATLCPEEAARYADTIVTGEAEESWPRLLDEHRQGRRAALYTASARPRLDGLQPRREIFRGKRYLPLGLVEAGRGCAMSCEFCAIQSFYHATHSPRPLGSVVDEITAFRGGRKSFFFVDDNLALNTTYVRELFQAISPLRLRWLGQMSVAAARDEDFVALMRRSGCAGVLLGFESLREGNLAAMRKPFNQGRQVYREALANLRSHGIGVFGTFVFGYDADTAETVAEALEFARQEAFYLAAFNHLVPFPGTPVYDRLCAEGKMLKPHWWLEPTYRFNDVAFQPSGIDPVQLRQRCLEARLSFYSPKSIWQRHRMLARHMTLKESGLFWSLNLMHRVEVRRRDGFPLGDENPGAPIGAAVSSKL